MHLLINKFKGYQVGRNKGLTMDECQLLLENEDHECFMLDYSLYSDIMDYRDHIYEEME
jgi:hypothetical protein